MTILMIVATFSQYNSKSHESDQKSCSRAHTHRRTLAQLSSDLTRSRPSLLNLETSQTVRQLLALSVLHLFASAPLEPRHISSIIVRTILRLIHRELQLRVVQARNPSSFERYIRVICLRVVDVFFTVILESVDVCAVIVVHGYGPIEYGLEVVASANVVQRVCHSEEQGLIWICCVGDVITASVIWWCDNEVPCRIGSEGMCAEVIGLCQAWLDGDEEE